MLKKEGDAAAPRPGPEPSAAELTALAGAQRRGGCPRQLAGVGFFMSGGPLREYKDGRFGGARCSERPEIIEKRLGIPRACAISSVG
jgi:hypothetical protein